MFCFNVHVFFIIEFIWCSSSYPGYVSFRWSYYFYKQILWWWLIAICAQKTKKHGRHDINVFLMDFTMLQSPGFNFSLLMKKTKLIWRNPVERQRYCKSLRAVTCIISKLGLIFDHLPLFSNDPNELGMTSITRN